MATNSKTSHAIKKRVSPNDVFITPLGLAEKAISMVDYKSDDIWYDPFRGTGSYYNQYPNNNKKWSEITDGRDFFTFNESINIITSNPPYSILDKCIKKFIELKPHTINLLIGINNLTPRRIEILNNAGYYLTKFHMCKVYKWYGMSVIVQFEVKKKECICLVDYTYDRHVWKTDTKFKFSPKILDESSSNNIIKYQQNENEELKEEIKKLKKNYKKKSEQLKKVNQLTWRLGEKIDELKRVKK
jgi:hypothetical protein